MNRCSKVSEMVLNRAVFASIVSVCLKASERKPLLVDELQCKRTEVRVSYGNTFTENTTFFGTNQCSKVLEMVLN